MARYQPCNNNNNNNVTRLDIVFFDFVIEIKLIGVFKKHATDEVLRG
jgi:hypothetical protein